MNEDEIEVGPMEYLVTDADKVGQYVNKAIGVGYEITYADDQEPTGSVTVYDLTLYDHKLIRNYINQNDLWSE